MSRFDWFVILLLIVMVIGGGFWEQTQPPRTGDIVQPAPRRRVVAPPVAEPEVDADAFIRQIPAAPATRLRINLIIEDDHGPRRRGSFIGTAWALAGGTSWLSARHVTDDCRRLSFLSGDRLPPATGHPAADVSAIVTGRRHTEGLTFSRYPLTTGEDVYLVGFPSGQAAAVYGTVTGTGTLDHRTLGHRETVIVVAQRKRVPPGSADLSGISGGPVLDSDGNVIGTVIGGSERRARSIISLERNVAWLAATAGGATDASLDSDGPDQSLTPANFVRETQPLLVDGPVRVVRCDR